MNTRVARIPRNTQGRDFVVGDIHGAFDQVAEALKRVRFRIGVDRLFCVGDLIDRGPQSARALRFLLMPGVHAVRGNHEDTFIQMFEQDDHDPKVLQAWARMFHMDWMIETTPQFRRDLRERFLALPVAMEVDTPRGLVGIVHAEVPSGMDWPTFRAAIERGDEKVTQAALEGRDRIKRRDASGVAGIGRVFVGHTPQWGGVARLGNVYAVDTGAIFPAIREGHEGHLTMAEMMVRTQVLSTREGAAQPLAQGSIDLVELSSDEAQDVATEPFGAYATGQQPT